MIHSLMVKDHYEALRYVMDSAAAKTPVTVEFIQQINARVMKSTGSIYNTVFGEIDASKGMFRKGNVSAGGTYFPNYDKVIPYTTDLVKRLVGNLPDTQSLEEGRLARFHTGVTSGDSDINGSESTGTSGSSDGVAGDGRADVFEVT